MARTVHTVQAALRAFAEKIASEQVFEEASIALDADLDYRLTILCTEKDGGYVVAMHRENVNRLNCWNFTKLGHGEWDSAISAVPAGKE